MQELLVHFIFPGLSMNFVVIHSGEARVSDLLRLADYWQSFNANAKIYGLSALFCTDYAQSILNSKLGSQVQTRACCDAIPCRILIPSV